MRVPFFRPSINQEEVHAVEAVLQSGWLSSGKVACDFEKEMCTMLCREKKHPLYTISVQSATAGLHLSLASMQLPRRSVVLTTPYTFVSTVNSIIYADLQFKLIDVVAEGYLIDPDRCIAEINKNTQVKAIMPVLLAGDSLDYTELYTHARKKGIKIIEDAAHAFPARTPSGYLGTSGDAGVYSFYGNKTITTGEGGMVVCHDKELYKRIMVLRQNGFEISPYERKTNERPWHEMYNVTHLGYKYNMPDILAAIGRVQLQKSERMHSQRALVVQHYTSFLQNLPYLSIPHIDSKNYTQHSWHLFIIQFIDSRLDRDTIMAQLYKRGIQCSVHYKPIHLHSYYKTRYKLNKDDYPNATKSYQRSLSLPLFPDMTEEEIHYVCTTLIEICEGMMR